MIISSPLPDDVWNLQKECPSQWHLGQGSNSLSLIMTSSPQTHLLRNTRGFQTSMSKHASFTKTHKYLPWLLSGLLSTVPLPLALLPMEKTSRPNVQERSAIRPRTDRAGRNYPFPPINCRSWNAGVELSVRLCLCWPSALTKGFLAPGWLWAGEVETVVRYLQNSVLWAYFW